jgi:hypothetical protein
MSDCDSPIPTRRTTRPAGSSGSTAISIWRSSSRARGRGGAIRRSLWLHTNWAMAAAGSRRCRPGHCAIMGGWLKHGRPAGYDRDKLEDCCGGGDFTPGAVPASRAKATTMRSDGRLVDDMMVFGSPDRGGVVAKGFWLEPPDLRGASIARNSTPFRTKCADCWRSWRTRPSAATAVVGDADYRRRCCATTPPRRGVGRSVGAPHPQ